MFMLLFLVITVIPINMTIIVTSLKAHVSHRALNASLQALSLGGLEPYGLRSIRALGP